MGSADVPDEVIYFGNEVLICRPFMSPGSSLKIGR